MPFVPDLAGILNPTTGDDFVPIAAWFRQVNDNALRTMHDSGTLADGGTAVINGSHVVDSSAAAVSVTLPTGLAIGQVVILTLTATSTNDVTVAGTSAGAHVIQGGQGSKWLAVWDGTGWMFDQVNGGNHYVNTGPPTGLDQTVELQAIVDGFPATGGTLQFDAGTYIGRLAVPSFVSIRGRGPATVLKLPDNSPNLGGPGDGPHVITNADWTGGNTDIVVADMIVNGNRANNTGNTETNLGLCGVNFHRVGEALLENVIAEQCRGRGVHIVGDGVETKNVRITNVTVRNNDLRGLYVGARMREVFYNDVLATGNGTLYNDHGVVIDHSEAYATRVVAQSNKGAGIWIRNVRNCDVNGLVAKDNENQGIIVFAFVDSTGTDWTAIGNCANYNALAGASAEVDFNDDSGSYGITARSKVSNIHTTGSTGSNTGSTQFANYGVWVDDGVTEDVVLEGLTYGGGQDAMPGGLIAPLRLPRKATGHTLTVTDFPTGSSAPFVRRRPSYKIGQGRLALTLDGTGYIGTPEVAAFEPTTSLRAEAMVSLADWTPASGVALAAKFNSASQRSWTFNISPAGAMQFQYSPTGGTPIMSITGPTLGALVVDGGAPIGLAVEVNLTTGDASFQWSDDGDIWTELEMVAGSGAITIFDGTADLRFGDQVSGPQIPITGSLHWGRVFVDGVIQAAPDLTLGILPITDAQGNVWTGSGGTAWTAG